MSEVVATLEYQGKQYTVHKHDWTHPDEDADEQEQERLVWWMWTEGNYGCDCNRFAFISYEHDDWPGESDESGKFPCGETITLVGLTLDGKDLLAPDPEMQMRERLAAIGLKPAWTLLGDFER